MTTQSKRRIFLAILLLLVTVSGMGAQAKDFTSRNRHLSISFGRNLQEEGKNSLNSDRKQNSYLPHPEGTPVVYEDQDGTYMVGKIEKFNSDTQTYTIKWDEDDMKEDFSDLSKVDHLVENAEKSVFQSEEENEKGFFPINTSREQQQENGDVEQSISDSQALVDTDYAYDYEDLSTYVSYSTGTPVLLEFADGWYEGKITDFSLSDDKKNASYTITWSDDTNDTFENELEWMDLIVMNAENYIPWEIGTPTYGYPNSLSSDPENAYLSGEITAFENGRYTITWSDGEDLFYSDFDMVDELVNNAGLKLDPYWMESYDPWPKGTPVSWDFDDGWWDGTITDFSSGTYEVTWSDDSFKYYSNVDKVDQMVAFASGEGYDSEETSFYDDNYDYDDSYGDYYDLGTVVYAEFEDGWWAGYVDSFEDDYYVIRWSDDSVDKFLPGEEMDEMVMQAQYIPYDYGIYPVGTHVRKKFDGVWYSGEIEYSEGGFYTTLWDDGTRTTYVSGNEIDEMVIDAYKIGMSLSGKIALSLFVICFLGGVVFYSLKNNSRKKQSANVTESVRENELILSENNDNYSDQQLAGVTASVV
eukprot:CAMPEP_0197185098 /NCGR_PEP_ID=MMETSP1423-20130617/11132_1 /TAXON_ID=476441 /ORGANISM="Pseudo-nitzschia heimii, Strain UNC1101" /LENGTH=584 /DNA_ID=CAMNT_0042636061 /DNA_START=184 /DNA_END=1938 /DNA_ORIENTATION=+